LQTAAKADRLIGRFGIVAQASLPCPRPILLGRWEKKIGKNVELEKECAYLGVQASPE